VYPFAAANDVLAELAQGRITGEAVLQVARAD
jgi:hypothetical protein